MTSKKAKREWLSKLKEKKTAAWEDPAQRKMMIKGMRQKLTKDEAKAIYKMKGKVPAKEAARQFNISSRYVYDIWNGIRLNDWTGATTKEK